MGRAVAYLRTSSAANVSGDSAYRQDRAIMGHAGKAGVEVLACFWDQAVSGADPIDQRPGFAALLEYVASEGLDTILVETANRFARDLIVQETGYQRLRGLGVYLVAADDPDGFTSDTPTAILIRQVLGAVAQFDKSMTVDKLRAARDRRSVELGRRIEGRKSRGELDPELQALAKRLRRKSRRTGMRRSLRDIQAALAEAGYLSATGKPLALDTVARLVA